MSRLSGVHAVPPWRWSLSPSRYLAGEGTQGAVRGLRVGVWALAAAIAAWAFIGPQFRDAEGALATPFCLVLAVSEALVLVGWAIGGPWRSFGGWLALALVGQAAALQLIDAGSLVRYQHYRSFDRLLTETSPVVLLGIGLQTVVVLAALRRRWSAVYEWARGAFRPWQLIVLSLALLLTSAPVARDVPLYAWTVLVAGFIQAVNVATVLLLAWSVPDGALRSLARRLDALLGPTAASGSLTRPRIDRFALLAALWVTGLAALLSLLAYERVPHITDEIAYFLQARMLASGALALPAPPAPPAFELYLLRFQDGMWYVPTPPGWPALLALGVRLGIPWLVNPILAGLNTLLAYLLMQEVYSRRLARIVVLLACFSPWYIFMAMNFMTHTLSLTCALGSAVLLARVRRGDHWAWSGLAGLLAGAGTLIRPLDGLITIGLLGLWAAAFGARRLRPAVVAAFGLGALVSSALVLPYNTHFTGSPGKVPLNVYIEETFGPGKNDFGFGPNQGFDWGIDALPGHSPLEGLVNANLNAFSMNVELLGWSTGSLLFIALLLLSRRLSRGDYLMVGVCLVVFTLYFFYYFSGGPDFGARYWFLMMLPALALTARGVLVFIDTLQPAALNSVLSTLRVRVFTAVGALCLMALLVYVPWRAIDKYHHFWGVRPDIPKLAAAHHFGGSLVLIHGTESHPDFAAAAIFNPLDMNAPEPIYAWDRGPDTSVEVIHAYRDRPVWLIDGPSVTGRGYRLVAGPLSADEALGWFAWSDGGAK